MIHTANSNRVVASALQDKVPTKELLNYLAAGRGVVAFRAGSPNYLWFGDPRPLNSSTSYTQYESSLQYRKYKHYIDQHLEALGQDSYTLTYNSYEDENGNPVFPQNVISDSEGNQINKDTGKKIKKNFEEDLNMMVVDRSMWTSPEGTEMNKFLTEVNRLIDLCKEPGLDPMALQTRIAQVYWLVCNVAPYKRGTAAVAEYLRQYLYEYHGLQAPLPKKEEPLLDCIAISIPLAEFCEKHESFLDIQRK